MGRHSRQRKDWDPHLVQLRICETIRRSAEPLSAVDVASLYRMSVSQVAYHLEALVQAGAIHSVGREWRSGALRKLYAIPLK